MRVEFGSEPAIRVDGQVVHEYKVQCTHRCLDRAGR